MSKKFKGNGYYYIQLVEDVHNDTSKNKREHFAIQAGETVIAGLKKGSNGLSARIANPADPCSVYHVTKYNFSGCWPEFAIIAAVPAAPVRKLKEAESCT